MNVQGYSRYSNEYAISTVCITTRSEPGSHGKSWLGSFLNAYLSEGALALLTVAVPTFSAWPLCSANSLTTSPGKIPCTVPVFSNNSRRTISKRKTYYKRHLADVRRDKGIICRWKDQVVEKVSWTVKYLMVNENDDEDLCGSNVKE